MKNVSVERLEDGVKLKIEAENGAFMWKNLTAEEAWYLSTELLDAISPDGVWED